MTDLSGRTVALAMLEREEMLAVSAAVEGARGDWQAFNRVADPAKLRAFDAIVCGAASAAELAKIGPPVLAVGVAELSAPHDFVLPPLRPDEVLLRIERLLSAATTHRAAEYEVPVILTADDDPTTTAIVRAVVTQNAMTCKVARDRQAALELAREVVPTAIVLDVNMPYRDGFEVLSALREHPRTAAIPVLMLTSVQQEADVVNGFRLCADDYVIKPFNPMELLARIKRLVRRA